MARSGDYLLARLTGQWGWWAWPALLALPLALGLRLCRTARRAPDPEGAAVAAACAGLAADARLRPLRRAGKGGMLFPCAGLRRAGRRERA